MLWSFKNIKSKDILKNIHFTYTTFFQLFLYKRENRIRRTMDRDRETTHIQM